MTRINRYDIYRHCLKLAKEILRRGNFEGQQIYIHVGDQKYWETELLRPYRPDREPRGAVANIGLKHDGIIFNLRVRAFDNSLITVFFKSDVGNVIYLLHTK